MTQGKDEDNFVKIKKVSKDILVLCGFFFLASVLFFATYKEDQYEPELKYFVIVCNILMVIIIVIPEVQYLLKINGSGGGEE